MTALKLTAEEVAAAARVQKGTVYRILRGETKRPHYSTMRRLCKVLQLDLADVVGAEQIEFISNNLESGSLLSELEELLVAEIEKFVDHEPDAIEAVLFALAQGELEAGREAKLGYAESVARLRGSSLETGKLIIIERLRIIPRELRPTSVQHALGQLVDLRLALGAVPDAGAYTPLVQLRYRCWAALDLPKRRRPPPRPVTM